MTTTDAMGEKCACFAGQVSMRYEVRDLIVTAQDMCGNSLPPPADASFVMVETVTGSSASAQHVAASGAVAHQLPLLRQGGQIKVLPFVIVSTEPGETGTSKCC